MAGKDADKNSFSGYGLVGFAEHEFQLSTRQKDGSSLREHLESVQRQTGNTPSRLEQISLPYCIVYLWHWFCELSGGRGYSEHGPMQLTYSEIFAWSQLMKIELMVWEVTALKQVDRVFIAEATKK